MQNKSHNDIALLPGLIKKVSCLFWQKNQLSGPTKKQSLPVWCYEQPNTPVSAEVRAVCTFSGTPAIEEEPVFSLFPILNKADIEDIVFNTLSSEKLFQKWHAFYSI